MSPPPPLRLKRYFEHLKPDAVLMNLLYFCRRLQFGIKFFSGTGAALVLIIVLQDTIPALRDWKLLYSYFTFVVILNEKVL